MIWLGEFTGVIIKPLSIGTQLFDEFITTGYGHVWVNYENSPRSIHIVAIKCWRLWDSSD